MNLIKVFDNEFGSIMYIDNNYEKWFNFRIL